MKLIGLLFLIIIFSVSCSDSTESNSKVCNNDNDCKAGERCIESICKITKSCQNNYDCNSNQYCDFQILECVDNVDCRKTQNCEKGFTCNTRIGMCQPNEFCQTNDDCGTNFVCDTIFSGKCVNQECIKDDDCTAPEICLLNNTCGILTGCRFDSDCTETGKPSCDLATNQCVECVNSSYCESPRYCNLNTKICDEIICENDIDCGENYRCDRSVTPSHCVENSTNGCNSNEDCKDDEFGKICYLNSNPSKCVECVIAENCDGFGKICENNYCKCQPNYINIDNNCAFCGFTGNETGFLDMYEGINVSRETAVFINSNYIYYLNTHGINNTECDIENGKDKWFKFDVESYQNINIFLSFDNSKGNIDLALYKEINGTLQLIKSSVTNEGVEQIQYLNNETGIFYIKIISNNHLNAFSLYYTLESPCLPNPCLNNNNSHCEVKNDGAFECVCNSDYYLNNNECVSCNFDEFLSLNNSRANAALIEKGIYTDLNTYSKTNCNTNSSEDWYIIKLENNERIRIYLNFQHSYGNIDLELKQFNNTRIGISSGFTNTETISFTVPENGSDYYLIRVFGGRNIYNMDIFVDVKSENGNCEENYIFENGYCVKNVCQTITCGINEECNNITNGSCKCVEDYFRDSEGFCVNPCISNNCQTLLPNSECQSISYNTKTCICPLGTFKDFRNTTHCESCFYDEFLSLNTTVQNAGLITKKRYSDLNTFALDCSSKSDKYFKIHLNTGERIRINMYFDDDMSFGGDDGNLDLSLLRNDGVSVVALSNSTDNDEFITYLTQYSEDYYIKVSATGRNIFDLDVFVEKECISNSNCLTNYNCLTGENNKKYCVYNNCVDLNCASNGSEYCDSLNGFCMCSSNYFYNSVTENCESPCVTVSCPNESVCVAYSYESNSYNCCNYDEFNSLNNTVTAAVLITSGVYNLLNLKAIDCRYSSPDYFKIYIQQNQRIKIYLTFSQYLSGDIDLGLLNSVNQTVSSSVSGTDDENLSYVALETGYYFIKTYLNGSPTGKSLEYNMDIKIQNKCVNNICPNGFTCDGLYCVEQ